MKLEKMHYFKQLSDCLRLSRKFTRFENWIESLPCVLSLAAQRLIKGQFSGFRGSKFVTKTAGG